MEFSFQDVQGIQNNEWVGLANYQAVFDNPRFTTAVMNTFVYTIMTLIILIPIPLALAALLDRGHTYKPMVWRIALFIPALASLVVVSFLFRIVLARGRPVELGAGGPWSAAPGLAHLGVAGDPITPHHRDLAVGGYQHALLQQRTGEHLA